MVYYYNQYWMMKIKIKHPHLIYYLIFIVLINYRFFWRNNQVKNLFE